MQARLDRFQLNSRSAGFILVALLCALLPHSAPVAAEVTEQALTRSLVHLEVYRGRDIIREGGGFVAQADRFNGYIVTNAELLQEADSITVRVPGTGGQLVGQVIRTDLSSDYALVKVNGLDLPSLAFSQQPPGAGEVVWSAAKLSATDKVTLSKGILRTGFKLSQNDIGWYQHTAGIGENNGGVLLNECGQVVGLDFSRPSGSGTTRAVDLESLKSLLNAQNVKLTLADSGCVSEVSRLQQKAELAAKDAQKAQNEAVKAQEVARSLERQLKASNQNSADLIQETRLAKLRADDAIKAAEMAEAKADDMRRELEERTQTLRQETQELLKAFEEDRQLSEERFKSLLKSQEEAARDRERILIGFVGVLIVTIGLVLFLARNRGGGGPQTSDSKPEQSVGMGAADRHHEELAEYVLDGRDDDGIRYLLRISGDQLSRNHDGVIIGRNPKDSPYIINHADVSRKHARLKVMKNRVFIEDLGSTNGTSVNGQSIDDKGLVSVSSGDQIIIGSVVMKLRVLDS